MTLPLPRYLFDASALINLVRGRMRPRQLTRLVDSDTLRLPGRVAQEIRRRDDQIKDWVNQHPNAIIRETPVNTAELERIAVDYAHLLGQSRRGADAVLVAMALHYGNQGIIVTDDGGIQAVCFEEGIPYLTSPAFRHREGL